MSANWIPDINRFGVPKPPAWFLKALCDQDAALVILPSRCRRVYLLTRRRRLSLRGPALNAAKNNLLRDTRGSAGDLLATHNLEMVGTITGYMNGSWSPTILRDLKERDTGAAGGADAYIARIEAAEAAALRKKRTDLLDSIDHRARDAYRSLQARTGQRNQHANNRGGARGRATLVK